MPERKMECPTCGHHWLDKYEKNECPKCLKPLRKGAEAGRKEMNFGQDYGDKRTPGEASTHKSSAGSAMESSSGECTKGGPHTWKFGKCSKCGLGEGAAAAKPVGECPKGGKHVFKFAKCTKCGVSEGGVSSAPAGHAPAKKVVDLEEELEAMFDTMDADGDGYIDEDEAITCANALGVAPQVYWHVLKKEMADPDAQGISYDEFAAGKKRAFFDVRKVSVADAVKEMREANSELASKLGGAAAELEKKHRAAADARKSCPSCGHSWLDKYGKDECPKCLSPLGGGAGKRAPGEASTHKASAGSAMESSSGECTKGGPHTWKFGKCSKCGLGEGAAAAKPVGECPKGGKHIYKFGKCSKCGAAEF